MFSLIKDYFITRKIKKLGGFYHNGRFHSVKYINNKPYREVVEVIIFKDDMIFANIKDDGSIQFPGGSLEPDKLEEDIAFSECQEEARITINKNSLSKSKWFDKTFLVYGSIRELNNPDRPKWKKSYNGHVDYVGKNVHVFTAEYLDTYDGPIDPRDEHKMAELGRFYKITDLYYKLRADQRQAVGLFIKRRLEGFFKYTIGASNNLAAIIKALSKMNGKIDIIDVYDFILNEYNSPDGELYEIMYKERNRIRNEKIAKHYNKPGRRTTGSRIK